MFANNKQKDNTNIKKRTEIINNNRRKKKIKLKIIRFYRQKPSSTL